MTDDVRIPDVPAWAVPKLVAALEQLPEAENAQARAIIASGNHLVRRDTFGGVPALVIDYGVEELWLDTPDNAT